MGPSIYDVHTEGGQVHVDGEGISSKWPSTHKIRALWRHCIFFSCKEVGVFCTRISSLEWI